MNYKSIGRFLGMAIITTIMMAAYFVAMSYFVGVFYVYVMTPVLHLNEPCAAEGQIVFGVFITFFTTLVFFISKMCDD